MLRSPLGSELLEVFRKHLSRPCDNNPDLLDALLLGKTVDSIDCKDIPDSIRSVLLLVCHSYSKYQ